MMYRPLTLALVALAVTASGSALAQKKPAAPSLEDPVKRYESPAAGAPPSDKTRAEVKAETRATGDRGSKPADDRMLPPRTKSDLTRAQVKAATKADKTHGDVRSSYASPAAGAPKSEKSRAQVKAETREANVKGSASADK